LLLSCSAIVKQSGCRAASHIREYSKQNAANNFANFLPDGVLSAEVLPFPPRESPIARSATVLPRGMVACCARALSYHPGTAHLPDLSSAFQCVACFEAFHTGHVIARRVELSSVSALRAALNGKIHVAQLLGRKAQRHHLNNSHHHVANSHRVPGSHLRVGGGKFSVKPVCFRCWLISSRVFDWSCFKKIVRIRLG
jgi:hypothetical protein